MKILAGIRSPLLISLIVAVCIVSSLGAHASNSESVLLYPIADSYIESMAPDNNYGESDYLTAAHWKYESGPDDIVYSYLMFNLETIPPEASIDACTLTIFTTGIGPTVDGYVHVCPDSSWEEYGINWRNAPAPDARIVDQVVISESLERYSFDVKEAIPQADTAGRGRVTLVVSAQEKVGGGTIYFFSREALPEDYRPKLEVTYSIGGITTHTAKETPVVQVTETLHKTMIIIETSTRILEEASNTTVTSERGSLFTAFPYAYLIIGVIIGLGVMFIIRSKTVRERLVLVSDAHYCPYCGGELKTLPDLGKKICQKCSRIYGH